METVNTVTAGKDFKKEQKLPIKNGKRKKM